LVDSTTYFARFVAINAKGTSIGDTIAFATTTPVGKLLKRRIDPADPAPVVAPTPATVDEPLVIVEPFTRRPPAVSKASSRIANKAVKKAAKTKTTKRSAEKKRSVVR